MINSVPDLEQKTTVNFDLSVNELAYILALNDAQLLPGMDDNQLPNSDDDDAMQAILEAGAQSLLERQLLYVVAESEDEVALDPALQATVWACLNSTQMMAMLWRQGKNPAAQSYFYRSPQMVVMHTMPQPSCHHFEIGTPASADLGLGAATHLLGLLPATNGVSQQAYRLTQDTFAEAVDLSETNTTTATHLLTAAGVQSMDAATLVETLSQVNFSLMLQFVAQLEAKTEQKAITFLSNGVHAWCVEADPTETEEITVYGVSQSAAASLVSQAYAQLM